MEMNLLAIGIAFSVPHLLWYYNKS
jgi:hypothetical protein